MTLSRITATLAGALLLCPGLAEAQGRASLGSHAASALRGYADDVQSVRGDLDGAGDAASTAAGRVEGAMEGHNALADLDRQLDGALDDPEPDVPPVPAGCLARGAACEECYGRAYEQLARSRLLLLRARALFDATHRFASAAQAHGDNVAPSTREAAIVWEMQKPRIRASLAQFDATYDRKIADMLAVVQQTLRDIALCEKLYYETQDWYERFGFIYFEFLQARYQRG